jgi:hypothetical protein
MGVRSTRVSTGDGYSRFSRIYGHSREFSILDCVIFDCSMAPRFSDATRLRFIRGWLQRLAGKSYRFAANRKSRNRESKTSTEVFL